HTPHKSFKTPMVIPLPTKPTLKTMTPEQLTNIQPNIILPNTYHFSLQPPNHIINHPRPLHKFINSHPPILTHSPRFQLFTLTNFPKISQQPLQFTHH
ncbi:tRNA-guanine transglycosylase, partial [Staphylococcus epidermidis]|uniref:tRNA-guanine transglycosylase n=1 Tax=Staphylococcus epidermidis TaxID=1282 RepID=UPI0011A790B0